MIANKPPRLRHSHDLILFLLVTLTALAVQASANGAQITPGRLPSQGAPWTGSTNEPGAFGAPSHGYDAKAVASFTSYPHDTYRSGVVRFGVAAFHINGIDRVIFGLNQPGGGPNDLGAWTPVTEMTINPDTGQAEYWVELNVSSLPWNGTADGKYVLRAIAFPKNAGTPRLIDYDHRFMSSGREYEWTFWVNRGGTLPDATTVISSGQSIGAAAQAVGEGGTVYLQSGSYRSEIINVSTPNGRYVTIRPAPGVNPESVVINSNAGTPRGANAFIKWMDVRVQPPAGFDEYGFLHNRNASQACLVLESIHYVGSGTTETRSRLVNPGPTGTHLSNAGQLNKGFYIVGRPDRMVRIENTYEPISRWTLLRGMRANTWGEDLFRDVKGAMDVRVEDWGRENLHADLWQVYYPDLNGQVMDNILFYNIDAVASFGGAQPIYGAHDGSGTWNSVAFVNLSFWRPDGVNGGFGGWWHTSNHFLLLNCTIYGLSQKIGSTGSSWHQPRIRNGMIRGCVFEGLNYMATSGNQDPAAIAAQDVTFSDNHYIRTNAGLYRGDGDPRTTRGGTPASLFMDPDNYTAVGGQATFAEPDMRPRPGSLLAAGAVPNRMTRLVTTDVHGVPRTAVTSIGAFASNVDPNVDSDNDGVPDITDGCPFESQLTEPGTCGCDPSPDDSDFDGVPDCVDLCPGHDDGDDDDGNGVPDGCDTPVGACVNGYSGWQSFPMAAVSGTLAVEYDAVPNGSGIDGVTTLSLGAPSSYNDCAMLVRFNSSGYIDARDGSTYRRETSVAYVPGQAYHFRVDADIEAKRYSVRVRPFGSGSWVTIASDHAFRTQQSDVQWIDHWGLNSGQGTHMVCNFDANPDAVTCTGDVDGDGVVSFEDLMTLLADWGDCSGCDGDLDDDGNVGFYDLLEVVTAMGSCT